MKDIVCEWYENKKNIDEMLHSGKGKLKKWEQAVSAFFPQSATILDVGCGMGREAFALSDKGFSIIGIDISKEVIRQVTELSKQNLYNLKFLHYDGRTLPFNDAFFDVIIIWSQTFGLLYGDKNKYSFLKECKRVLKKEGLLSFSGHDHNYLTENYPKNCMSRKFYPYDNAEIYWETFLEEELVQFALNAGFSILLCERGEIYKPEDGFVLHCLCKNKFT